MADRLRRPPRSHREFSFWQQFLTFEDEEALKTPGRVDYGLSQIAYEVYVLQVIVLNMFRERADMVAVDRTGEDFLVRFGVREPEPVKPTLPPAPGDAEPMDDKELWLAWARTQGGLVIR